MDVSVVTWIHNNEDTIEELYTRLTAVFEGLDKSYELVFVNDGSTDKSWELIKNLHLKDPHIKALNFRRYYGQAAGLQAGFDTAKGDVIFTIGANLENDPEELPKFLTEIYEHGYDMVCGFRKNKLKGRFFRSVVSAFANKLVSKTVGHEFKDVTTPVRAIKKDVLSNLRIYGDGHLFLPALATVYGAKFKEIEIEHKAPKGNSAPHVSDISKPHKALLDIIALKFFISFSTVPFSTSPVRFFGSLGFFSFLIGSLIAVYLAFEKFYFGLDIGGRPLLMVAVVLLVVGVQFIMMGLLGELMMRTYYEAQNKKTYTIKELFQ